MRKGKGNRLGLDFNPPKQNKNQKIKVVDAKPKRAQAPSVYWD